ncbi:superoxide dismutase family protein [Sphingorhabdus sp.]|jgi:Cu-Zn family superoxide dismutase|uniref:superoxide dismutase family protein n=1 Tax=Sphingorhabdus sp. TaxID=1902408 RepID=UPI0035B07285
MNKILFILLAVVPLVACKSLDKPGSRADARADLAAASLHYGDGSGIAKFLQERNGVRGKLWLQVPAKGSYAMHVHAVGKCDGPDFASAGPHWNPESRKHGLHNPAGPHRGDLPNIDASADLNVVVDFFLPDVRLKGEGGLIDADGAALVIHERADDNVTDPSGNSGKRIACGVITAQ